MNIEPETFAKCMKRAKKICKKYGDDLNCAPGICPFAFRDKNGNNDCYFTSYAPLDWNIKEIERAYGEWITKKKNS